MATHRCRPPTLQAQTGGSPIALASQLGAIFPGKLTQRGARSAGLKALVSGLAADEVPALIPQIRRFTPASSSSPSRLIVNATGRRRHRL